MSLKLLNLNDLKKLVYPNDARGKPLHLLLDVSHNHRKSESLKITVRRACEANGLNLFIRSMDNPIDTMDALMDPIYDVVVSYYNSVKKVIPDALLGSFDYQLVITNEEEFYITDLAKRNASELTSNIRRMLDGNPYDLRLLQALWLESSIKRGKTFFIHWSKSNRCPMIQIPVGPRKKPLPDDHMVVTAELFRYRADRPVLRFRVETDGVFVKSVTLAQLRETYQEWLGKWTKS